MTIKLQPNLISKKLLTNSKTRTILCIY